MTAAVQSPRANPSDAEFPPGTAEEQRAAAVSHLVHDARNWLTVLQVYCDLLRNGGAEGGKGRAWIEELSQAIERGRGLVLSLLDSAQAIHATESCVAARETAGPKTLDLAAVIQSRQPLLRRMAGNRIRVDSKTPSRAETEALREPEFDRILLNLVRNAIDAMPQGGRVLIELEPAGESQPHLLVLRVTDTGRGIPADVLPHIFDSGFSTKSTAQHLKSGRGYGLAIVRELTLAAGGSVRVLSRMGQGTCFTVELPTRREQVTPQPVTSLPGNPVSATKRSTQKPRRTRQPNNFDAHRKGTRVPC